VVGASLVLLLVGEGTWSFYELVLGVEAPTPSLADVGYLASYLAVVVARYGGEEFVVLLPGAGSDTVAAIGEGCRHSLESAPVRLPDGTEVRVTASLGGSSSDAIAPTREELIRLADRAMYEAKRRGRNKLVMAGHGDGAGGQRSSGLVTP
jgi:hypothetical protein